MDNAPLPVDPSTIPEDLLPFVNEFRFPTGKKIRRMMSSHEEIHGWVLEVGPTMWLYGDGVVASRPRYRACDAFGLASEDDLQQRPEEDWAAVAKLEEEFTRLLILPLAEVFALAKQHGYANRLVENGERVFLRDGRSGHVSDDGRKYDYGEHVRVEVNGEEHTYRLSDLRLLS